MNLDYLSSLFNSYRQNLIMVSFKYTKNLALSEEIVQEIFTSFIEKEISLCGEEKRDYFYLKKSVSNRSIDALRRRANQEISLSEDFEDITPDFNYDEINPENLLIKEEVLDTLSDHLREYPATERSIFIDKNYFSEKPGALCYKYDLTYHQLYKIDKKIKRELKNKLPESLIT